jgi:hypothetical protein
VPERAVVERCHLGVEPMVEITGEMNVNKSSVSPPVGASDCALKNCFST